MHIISDVNVYIIMNIFVLLIHLYVTGIYHSHCLCGVIMLILYVTGCKYHITL